jgi:hypothetical protein
MNTATRRSRFARSGFRWGLVAAVAAVVLGFGSPAYATPTATLYGPSSITSTGNYTYTGQFLVSYAWFLWYVRTCNTPSVDACTNTWIQQWGNSQDQFTQTLTEHLTYTCPPEGPAAAKGIRSIIPPPGHTYYQVKFTAGGFGQPAQTVYKVTDLCGAGPL